MVKNVKAAVVVTEMPKMIANEQVMVYSPVASRENYGSILLGDSSDGRYYFTVQNGVINLDIEKVRNYLASDIVEAATSAATSAGDSAGKAALSEQSASSIAEELKRLLDDTLPTIEEYLDDAQSYSTNAKASASAAEASEGNAKTSEENAMESEANARVSEEKAKASEERIVASAATLDRLTDEVAKNDKRLTNLERGLPADRFQTDATVSYAKQVPMNALPYAAIAKVGGMTRKSKNLCHVASITTDEAVYGGIAVPVTVQGTYTLSCDVTKFSDDTATNTRVAIRFEYADGTEILALGVQDKSNSERDGATRHKSVTGTTDPTKMLARITVLTLDFSTREGTRHAKAENIQLEYGSVETEYEPYFEGLRSAPVAEMLSKGKNLADIYGFSAQAMPSSTADRKLTNTYGTTISTTDAGNSVIVTQNTFGDESAPHNYVNGYFCIGVHQDLVNGEEYTFSCDVEITNNLGNTDNQMYVYVNGSGRVSFKLTNGRLVANGTWYTDGTKKYIEVRVAGVSAKFSNFMLERGHTDGTYTPYAEHILSIPEAVQNLDGYGMGIGEDAYNYVDCDKRQFVKVVGAVDLGSLTWVLVAGRFKTTRPVDGAKFYDNTKSVCICELYDTYAYNELYQNSATSGFTGISVDGAGYIQGVDSKYSNATEFKEAMQGVMLYFERSVPEIIDISDTLSADNMLEVESGGTITAVNEHEYAVPTEIIYQMKEAAG